MTKFPNIADTNYFTNRALENEKGENTGKIIMWRMKDEEEFRYMLKCPYCGHQQEKKEIFAKRPYRPKCDSCGKSVTISRINKKKK